MQLSIIILNYNVSYFLELCLQSVEAAISDLKAEIIVVDNNSSDDSCKMVKSLFPKVKLIENNVNYGFSKGNNLGVDVAKGEYICILNPDTIVPEDVFTKLIDFVELRSDVGIVGCKLIDGKGNFLPESKRNIPTPKVAFQKLLGRTINYYSSVAKDGIAKVDILVGAFMFLKRSVYKSVGGFDEDYFMYGEDIDLSYRVHKKGFVNYYNGELSALHFKGESTIKDKLYAKRFYSAMYLFYKKHFSINYFLTAVVYVITKLAIIFSSKNSENQTKLVGTYIISKRSIAELKSKLPLPMHQFADIKAFKKENLMVLDAEIIRYKDIIETISSLDKYKTTRFRIWPKNSSFIIGSDSNRGRGEIIKF